MFASLIERLLSRAHQHLPSPVVRVLCTTLECGLHLYVVFETSSRLVKPSKPYVVQLDFGTLASWVFPTVFSVLGPHRIFLGSLMVWPPPPLGG